MPIQKTTTSNFRFSFQPLQISPSICVVQEAEGDSAGVPGIQMYDSIGGGYYPDYTVFPLVIQPEILAYDPDKVLGQGDVRINRNLANARWKVIEDGVTTLIDNTNTDYEMTTTGENLGRLRILRNARPYHPLTFVFEAQYLDSRTREIHPIEGVTFLLTCGIQIQQCVLKVDAPSNHYYNPLKAPLKVVRASVFSGDKEVPSGHCRCRWQILDNDQWRDVGSRVDLSFASVSPDTMGLAVNMDYMGQDCVVRCLGFVGESSADASAKYTAGKSFDEKTFRITRKMPAFRTDIAQLPPAIPRSQTEVYPVARVTFDNYSGANSDKEIKHTWGSRSDDGSNAPYTIVAEGSAPTIKANRMGTFGQMLQLVSQDRGPYNITTDSADRVLTDGEGRVILTR